MRIAQKLAVLCVMAFAATALAASTASAQEPVEVEHEGGAHCSVTEPCVIEAHGESHLSIFGFIVSNCDSEFTAEILEDGTGHVTNAVLVDHAGTGGDCTRVPCNGVGEAPSEVEWDITNTHEAAPDEVVMERNFCLDAAGNPNGAGIHCNAPISVAETAGTHHYTFSMAHTCPSGVRFESQWEIEGTPIEIEHDGV